MQNLIIGYITKKNTNKKIPISFYVYQEETDIKIDEKVNEIINKEGCEATTPFIALNLPMESKNFGIEGIINETNVILENYKFSISFDKYGQIDVKIPDYLLPIYNEKLKENRRKENEYYESLNDWIINGIRN